MAKKTSPSLFIIESLKFEDEQKELFEGHVISQILNFVGIESEYYYVRTKREFEHVIDIFKESKYRYLHISCHGDRKGIATTLDDISFQEMGLIMQHAMDKKRLFISACSVMNRNLANEMISNTECHSVIGPSKDIDMDDAVIFWSAFYQLVFKKNRTLILKGTLEEILKKLIGTFEFPVKYYTSSRSSPQGWKEIPLTN